MHKQRINEKPDYSGNHYTIQYIDILFNQTKTNAELITRQGKDAGKRH
jgi:hypothetical protein